MMTFLMETEAGDALPEVEGTRTEALEIAQVYANTLGTRVAVVGEGTPTWVAPKALTVPR